MSQYLSHRRWRLLLGAFFLAAGLVLFFPATSFAHAELLRSDPTDGAVLRVAPVRVRMWFSEALDRSPTFSGAVVVDANNHSVDIHDAQVVSGDALELDVSLMPHLPAGNYLVAWHVASQDDGHLTSGTISFTVTRADGSLPPLGTPSDTQTSGSALSINASDGSPLVAFILTTLLDLAAVFWVGTHLFQQLVLQTVSEEHEELREINICVQRRAERLALVALLLLLFANSGVLLQQVVAIANQNNGSATDPSLWLAAITSGQFGLFWLVRELLIILALRLAIVPLHVKHPSPMIGGLLSWGNLLLSLALFLTIASTSHAAAATPSLVVYAVLADFLHLLAAALWIGGMLSIASAYLPLLRSYPPREQAHSLIITLSAYSPWAIVGVVLMALTGPFLATVRLSGWEQLFTTLYGQALTVKILLVGALLLTSALHAFWLRPRLRKTAVALLVPTKPVQEEATEGEKRPLLLTEQVKLGEASVARHVRYLKRILRWEAGAGISILICVGLMNVFAGTVSPTVGASNGTSTGLTATPSGNALHVTSVSDVKVIRRTSQPHLYILSPTDVGLMQPTLDANENVWVGEMTANRLARLNTRTGKTTTWEPPQAQHGIMTTAVDDQGMVWFVEQGANYIGRFDPARQTFQIFPLGNVHGHPMGPQALAFDAAGMLWFTAPAGGLVGRLDPTTGTVKSWDVPAPRQGIRPSPFSLTVTGDGQIWFGLLSGGAVGHLDPSSGQITLYPLPDAQTAIFSMAADGKGRIWLTELSPGKLGMIDPTTHDLLELPFPDDPVGTAAVLYALVVGHDGTIWCVDDTANALVRYDPTARTYSFFHFSSAASAPYGLTLDALGNIWFTAAGSPTIGKLTP